MRDNGRVTPMFPFCLKSVKQEVFWRRASSGQAGSCGAASRREGRGVPNGNQNMETRKNEDERGYEPVHNNENAGIAGMKAPKGRGSSS